MGQAEGIKAKAPGDALDRWREASTESTEPDNKNEDGDNKDDTEDGEQEKEGAKRFYQSTWFKIVIAIAVIALLAGALIWWLIARQYEDTDDAFVDTHIIHIAPQVAGQLLRVAVTDNQPVRSGQLLALIDPSDANAKLVQAQAQGAQAATQLQQALASQGGAQAQATNAARDLARYHTLQAVNPAAVAQQQLDQASATARNTRAQANAAAAQVAGAKAQIKMAEAEIAAARLTLSYTRIVAPADGHVTQESAAPGNYVSPGQDLMAIVPLKLWVTANFKETQLGLVRPGQPVTVSVDACSDADVRGHIDSIQRGAGQAFGILPPENATGNYVKVVQRVPVKIVLDHVPKTCVLGPGMSVEPSVKVR